MLLPVFFEVCMGKPQRFFRVEITADELRSLPLWHSSFLVASCLAITEIMTFVRLNLMAETTRGSGLASDVMQQAAFTQTMVLQRTISSKTLEYLCAVQAHQRVVGRKKEAFGVAFHKKFAKQVEQVLHGPTAETAVWMRNKITNHYLEQDLRELIDALPHSPSDPLKLFLHEKTGNSFYPMGEEIAFAEKIGSPEALDEWQQWTLRATRLSQDIHHDYASALIIQYFPGRTAVEEAVVPEDHALVNIGTTGLPFLYANLV